MGYIKVSKPRITKDWRDIEGYEGLYMVSRTGKIMVLERTVVRTMPDGTRRRVGLNRRIMKCSIGKLGYVRCSLSKDGVGTLPLLHVIVARAFVPGYKPGLEVNHKDGNKLNNRADNLEWVSHQKNMRHYHYVLKPQRVSNRL